jgi:hypothetical protein
VNFAACLEVGYLWLTGMFEGAGVPVVLSANFQ